MWAHVLLAAAVAAGIARTVDRQPRSREVRGASVPSAVVGTAGVGLLVFGVGELAPVPLAASAAVLVLFGVLEKRAVGRGAQPLVEWHLLRAPGMRAAQSAAAALPVGLGAVLVVGSQQVQATGGLGPAGAGALYAAVSIPVIAASPVAERLMRRFACRSVACAGMFIQSWGLVAAAVISAGEGSWAGMLAAFALVGWGAPIAFIPVTAAALEGVERVAGAASGVLNAAQQIGNALALGGMQAAMAVMGGGGGAPAGAAFAAGFLCAAVLCTAGAVPAARLVQHGAHGGHASSSGTPRGATGVE